MELTAEQIFWVTIAFHVDFGYSLFCRCAPKQHEERALCRPSGREMKCFTPINEDK